MSLILLILIPGLLFSQEKLPEESQLLGKSTLTMVNGVHSSLSDRLISASNYLDNFFADERMDDEGSRSKVVVSYLTAYDYFLGLSHEYVIRARLHLPRTEHKLRLIIDSSEDEVSTNEGDDALIPKKSQVEDRLQELRAALQYVMLSSKLWQISANSGVRFTVPPDPFGRLRIRRLFFVDKLKLRFVQSFFWYRSQGVGETTSFDIEKSLSDKLFFRSNSRVTALRDSDELSFRQSFSMFQDIGKKKILVYSVGAIADLNQPATTNSYYLNAQYRHNFYEKWAFYEIVPSLFFDRVNRFIASPGILLRLDIVFG